MGRASVIQFTAPAEEAGAGQVAAWIAAAEADGQWWGEGVTAPWLEGVYEPTPGEVLAALDACRVPVVTGGPDAAGGRGGAQTGAVGAGGAGGVGAGGDWEAGGRGRAGCAGEAVGRGCAGEGLEVVVDLATWRLGVSREWVRGHHNTGGAAATAAAATAVVGMTPAPVGPVALDVSEVVPAAPTAADAVDVAPAAPSTAAVPTATETADAAVGAVAAGVADAEAGASTAAAPTPTPTPTPTPAAAAATVTVPTVAGDDAELVAGAVAPAAVVGGGAATAAVGPAEAASAATPGDTSAAAPVVDAAAPTAAVVAPDADASAPDAAAAAAPGAASAGGGVAGWVRREWVQAPMCQEVRELLGLVPGPGLVAALSVIGRRSQCSCGRARLAADIDVGGLPPVPGVTAGLPCACQVILTAAWQAVEGWAQVAAMAAVVDAAAPEPVVSTPNLVHRARVTDGVCSELAGALALTTAGAAGRIATARDLYRFPDLVALAEEGIVIAPVWRAVLGESTNLPADAREVVVAEMVAKIRARHAAGKAPWTPSQARQMTRYAVLRLAPAIQDEARRNAFAGRRVTVTPAGDGMAWVSILMPDTDAFRVLNRLRSIANAIKADDPTDGRNAAQRQADVAIDLLLARTSPTGHPAGCDCGCCPTTPSTTGAGAVEDAETGPDADADTDSATAGCVGVRCARCGRCAHHHCTCPTSTDDTDHTTAPTDAADTPADTDTDADAAGDADSADADDSGVADSEDADEIEVIDAVTDAVLSAEGGAASAHTDSSTDVDASASVTDETIADADPDVEADADADAGAEVDAAAAGDCTEGAGDEIEVIDERGSADLGSTGATDVDAEDNAEEEASATVPGDTTVDTETTAAATADPKPPADADADADADSEADAGADADARAEAESGAEGNADTVAGAEVDADRNDASGAQTDAAADAEDVAGLSEWMREVYAALDAKSNDQRTGDTAGTIEAAAPDAATTATTVDVVEVEGDALPVVGQPTTTDPQPTTGPAPMPVVIDALGEPYESDPYAGVDDDRDLPPDPDPPPPWWSAQVRPPDPSHTGELCPNPVATHPATATNPSQQLRPAHLFNPARPLPPDPSDTGELCPKPVAGHPAAATSPCPGAGAGAGAGAAQAPAGEPQPQRLGQQALLEAEGSTGPVPRSARPEISVVVDLPTLLGLAHNPAVVPGMGPIDAATARALAAEGTWRLLITDPATGAVVATSARTYTPTAAVARLVRAREPYCRAPGCRRQAINSDLDHTTTWPDGDTTAANLGPLCRVHHNLKTHHGHHLTNLTTTTSSPAGTASADAASTASTSAPGTTPGDTTASPAGTTDRGQTTPTLTGWRWTLPSGLTHTHHPEPPLPE